jgi:predicted nucleic acid-binding protein
MKNVLVSNTGPLIALSIIGRMNLLPELFSHIIIPSEVYSELIASSFEARRIVKPSWLDVKMTQVPTDSLLLSVLDKGGLRLFSLPGRFQQMQFLLTSARGVKLPVMYIISR